MALKSAPKAAKAAVAEPLTSPPTLEDTSIPATATAQAEPVAEWIEEPNSGQDLPATSAEPVVPPRNALATPTPSAGGISRMCEGDGMEFLDDSMGFGSFPIISLDKTDFKLGNLGEVENFDCVILNGRKKFIFKSEAGDGGELFYSYDQVTDTSGALVATRLKDWVARGVMKQGDQIIREYAEVLVQMVDGQHNGKLFLLSIPPASVRRFAGYRAETKALKRQALNGVITRCSAGKKVIVGNKSFHPWEFTWVRNLSAEEIAERVG